MIKRLLYRFINHIYQLVILTLLMLPVLCVAKSNDFPSSEASQDYTLVGKHFAVFCFENNLPTSANTPKLDGAPKLNYQLQYEDHVYDLSQTTGFSGYFDLARWQKFYGDGGVDVTGAPNVALVEGADVALVKLLNNRSVAMQIDVPSEGYIRFDWRKIGGSYFSLKIFAGSQEFSLEHGLNGQYISPLLQAGDQLRLVFSTPENTVPAESTINLDNFQFYTNTVQVIAREWQAIQKKERLASFTQFINVQSLDMEEIVFPATRHLADGGAIFDPTSLHPELMGFPYLDLDGKDETLADRHHLETSTCAFDVRWEDELILEDNNWIILRRWRVADLMADNVMEKTQVIKLYRDAIKSYPTIEKDMTQDIETVFRLKPVIQYLDWQAPND